MPNIFVASPLCTSLAQLKARCERVAPGSAMSATSHALASCAPTTRRKCAGVCVAPEMERWLLKHRDTSRKYRLRRLTRPCTQERHIWTNKSLARSPGTDSCRKCRHCTRMSTGCHFGRECNRYREHTLSCHICAESSGSQYSAPHKEWQESIYLAYVYALHQLAQDEVVEEREPK